MFRFPKKARGHSMCSTMVGGSWRLAVGGGWRLAVGNWRLVAVGGGWRRLVAGGWWLEAVGSGWQLAVGRRWRLAAVGDWRLVVGGWWRLAVDGSWRLAVGGPLGRSFRAVLSKKEKSSLKDPPAPQCPGLVRNEGTSSPDAANDPMANVPGQAWGAAEYKCSGLRASPLVGWVAIIGRQAPVPQIHHASKPFPRDGADCTVTVAVDHGLRRDKRCLCWWIQATSAIFCFARCLGWYACPARPASK